jgi:hypothetical protein
MSSIPENVLQTASERGTAVHSFCAAYAKKEWVPKVPEDLAGYFKSFQKWFDSYVDEVYIADDVEMVDDQFGYCGHMDLLVRSEKQGGVLLIDLKTPASVKRQVWGCQIAAYKGLIDRTGRYPSIDRAGTLRLNSEGKPAKFDEFTDNLVLNYGRFIAALSLYKFFEVSKKD